MMKTTTLFSTFALLAKVFVDAKCSSFTPAGDTYDSPIDDNTSVGQTIRVSPAFYCQTPGQGFNDAQFFSTCHANQSCVIRGSDGKFTPDTTLNITLENSGAKDDLFKIIAKATGLDANAYKKASNEIPGSDGTFCINQGTAAYVYVRVDARCVNGTLGQCDSTSPANGTAIAACIPQTRMIGNVNSFTGGLSVQNITPSDVSQYAKDDLTGAAGKTWLGPGMLALEAMVLLTAAWMAL